MMFHERKQVNVVKTTTYLVGFGFHSVGQRLSPDSEGLSLELKGKEIHIRIYQVSLLSCANRIKAGLSVPGCNLVKDQSSPGKATKLIMATMWWNF